MDKKRKVLFLSTGNSTRSQMAEAFLTAVAGEHFQPVSAGIDGGEVHPLALEVMSEVGLDISKQKPRTVAESLKDSYAYAIVVYDPAREHSPIFPFTTKLLRWNHADPAMAFAAAADKKEVFRRVRDEIRTNVDKFVNETVPQRQAPAAKAA